MSEFLQPSPEEIGLLHEEALTINDEVDERKKLEDNTESTDSHLAEIAITQRAEKIAAIFHEHPTEKARIMRTYKFTPLAGRFEAYIDPVALQNNPEQTDGYMQYLASEKFANDLEVFNQSLPGNYLPLQDLPTFFLHDAETAKKIAWGSGFVISSRISNIHGIVGPKTLEANTVFFHELCHVQEPVGASSGLFREGVACLVSDRVSNKNSHDIFVEEYNKRVRGYSSEHPMSDAQDENADFHLDVRRLIDRKATSRANNDWTSICTEYWFMASFLRFYQDNYDGQLAIIDQSQETTPNYSIVLKRLSDSFPPQTSYSGEKIMPPKIQPTKPEDLEGFGSLLQRIAIPDNDPLIIELAEKVENASSEEVASLCREFTQTAESRLDQIQVEYNKLISDRAKGSEVTPPTQTEPVPIERDGEEFTNYFANYSKSPGGKIHVDNIVNFNHNGLFLYRTPTKNNEDRYTHVIYIYNNPNHMIAQHEQISTEDWENLSGQPELIKNVSDRLAECSNRAADFYDWTDGQRNLVVEGSKNFGLEAGNFVGLRISMEELKPLVEALKVGNFEEAVRQQTHLSASIVHELTHNERDDGLMSSMQTEIASHIAQYIFDPHDNDILNQQLTYSLGRIEENRSAEETQRPLNLYDKASYAALLIMADKLAEQSEAVKSALNSDGDPQKLSVLREISGLIGDSEQKYLRENVLPEIMKLSNKELMQMVRDIEIKYAVDQDVMDMK